MSPIHQIENVLTKQQAFTRKEPNLMDYDTAREKFSWDSARAQLAYLPDERGLNIA